MMVIHLRLTHPRYGVRKKYLATVPPRAARDVAAFHPGRLRPGEN